MAGNNPFRNKQVPKAVRDEIARRQGKAGLEWVAKRFPWISVTSMSDACNDKFVTLTSVKGNSLYEEDYKRPLPVVAGIDVKKQGELGTTRKATVKITAFTDTQLVELQKCYFIPGMSVRVEWGWTVGTDNATVHNPRPPRNTPDTSATSIMKNATKTNPNYEGLQGIVANFSYGLTKDNYWECSVEVIAAAEAFASTKASTYDCPECVSKHKAKDGEKDSVEQDSTLYKFFKTLFEDYNTAVRVYQDALNVVAAIDGKKATIVQYNYNGTGRDENGGEKTSFWETITPNILNQPDTTDPFITWSTFEAAISLLSVKTSDKKYVFGRLTSTDIPITHFRCISCYNNQYVRVMSADPRVCILPGVTYDNLATQKAGPTPESCVMTDDNGVESIKLDNILINAVTLMIELKNVESNGDGSLRTYVTNVLNKINEACGGLWAFEVLSTSSDDDAGTEEHPTITVVDAKKYTPSPADVYVLPATPTDSVIRDFKLDMKMTESMKSQALYANGNSQPASTTNAGGSCGTNALKGFRNYGQDQIKNLAQKPKVDSIAKRCDECQQTNKGEKPPTFQELVTNVREDVTDSTTNALKSALKTAYASAVNSGNDQHCAGMILPFEFSFTLDGIGGFTFGQMVSCNRIPEEVRNAYDFQVTSVEHSITPNDWSTTVNTVCRFKSK